MWQHCQSLFLFVFEKEFEFIRWNFLGKHFPGGKFEWEFPRGIFWAKTFRGEFDWGNSLRNSPGGIYLVLLKMQGFHTKLTFQIEWSITTNFFIVFENLISLYESPINS